LYSSISKPINQEGYLKIEVIDSGPGIPSDAQENLFKKYQQLSNSSQQRKLGTGLGLWITKNICDKMNGKIRVTSQIGIGTTFTVTLKTKVAAAPRLTRQPTFVIPMSTVKLLIVEDDRFCAQIITRYIRDSNLPIEIVAIAENGFEAVNIYKEYFKKGERIDVITMDLEMEIMGGKEACKQIRDYELKNNIRPTKIFIISANCLDKEVNECTDTKGLIRADGFLRKPLESSELMTHLARVNVEPEERFSNIKHILIVDDDGFNQKLLEEMLTKQKIKTILASNGKQALEICQKRLKDISLVIMDCEMPEMDGWKATSAIKALCQDLNVDCPPIYGLTGHSSQEIEERCMAAGMSKVLKKPIAYNELVQNVKCLNARCTAQ
jgi:Response regulator containing a CheY-like receiver domain and a GGDEF domain